MKDFSINLSNNPNGMRLAIDWLDEPFEEMIKNLGPTQVKALNTAAYIIKKSVKDTFASKMPAANRPFKVPATSTRGYKITKADQLVDAVRQSSATDVATKVFMGGRESGSPLFIARMYNKNSKDRYAVTNKGVRLKKKKYLGHITGVDYFDSGIEAGQTEAIDAVNNIMQNYTEKYMN